MTKKIILNIVFIFSMIFLLNTSASAVPYKINLQGKLTYKSGEALNGEYEMKFLLYDQETVGSPLWQELHDNVEIREGIYNIQLGSVDPSGNPLDVDYFINNAELYLEVVITEKPTGTPETFPRQLLTSTAFAMKAAAADTAGSIHWTGIVDRPTGLDDGDDVIDADADPSNEIQTLGTSGNEITLTGSSNIIAPYAQDADTVDGQHANEFGDRHSLDAVDGNPVDAVYVDDGGNVGIGTTNPSEELDVAGNIQLRGMGNGIIFPDGTKQTTAASNSSKIYFSVKRDGSYNWPLNATVKQIDFSSNSTVWSNIGGAFNTTTGIFTAPVSGIYTFHGGIYFKNQDAGDLIYAQIRVGSKYYCGTWKKASGEYEIVTVSITTHLDSGQSAALIGYVNASSPPALVYGNTAPYGFTYFTGALVF